MATSGLVWGLTSGTAAWFVAWSPVKVDISTHVFTYTFYILVFWERSFPVSKMALRL